jgi:hypothetical protein
VESLKFTFALDVALRLTRVRTIAAMKAPAINEHKVKNVRREEVNGMRLSVEPCRTERADKP